MRVERHQLDGEENAMTQQGICREKKHSGLEPSDVQLDDAKRVNWRQKISRPGTNKWERVGCNAPHGQKHFVRQMKAHNGRSGHGPWHHDDVGTEHGGEKFQATMNAGQQVFRLAMRQLAAPRLSNKSMVCSCCSANGMKSEKGLFKSAEEDSNAHSSYEGEGKKTGEKENA